MCLVNYHSSHFVIIALNFIVCRERTTRLLTVLVFVVRAGDLPVRQDLNVEADADVTVKAPQPFNAQQVFSIPGRRAPLLVGPVARRPNVVGKRLSPAAENGKRSKAAQQKDPVEEELHVGPRWFQEPSTVYLWQSFGGVSVSS